MAAQAPLKGVGWKRFGSLWVVVVPREDVLSLRLALLSAHLKPDVPLWVTMFDRTIARELHHVVPTVHLISLRNSRPRSWPSTASPSQVRHSSRGRSGIHLVDDAVRLLVIAGAGLLLALLFDGAITMIALHEGVVDTLYFSTRSVATVAGIPGAATARY